MRILSHFSVNFTKENFKQFFSRENIGNIIAQILLVCLFWGSLWGLLEDKALPPNGYIFNLLVVVVSAHISGKLMQLFNLPPLLGMIWMGLVLNNRDQIGFSSLNLNEDLTRVLRHTALVIILIRAGFELDKKKLAKLRIVCLRLAFMPSIVEVVTVALTSYYLLQFPMKWGFLLGFLLSAVSPAVIVPPIIDFKKECYGADSVGMDKGIPTLLIASASIDDILSILGIGFWAKLIFSKYSNLYLMLRIPIEPLIGVMTGIMNGLILWYIPSAHCSEPQKLFLLLFAGLSAQFLFTSTDLRAAGTEACFVTAFVASLQWRSDQSINRIENDLKDFWVIFQSILFGLVGTEVRISEMTKDYQIILGLICLIAGVVMRFLTAICVTFGENLSFKEKIFIGFAWLPKVTTQVAMSPIIMEMATNSKNQLHIKRARLVMDIAFLSVLLTAPLGAIAIRILGPRVLKPKTTEKKKLLAKRKNSALI